MAGFNLVKTYYKNKDLNKESRRQSIVPLKPIVRYRNSSNIDVFEEGSGFIVGYDECPICGGEIEYVYIFGSGFLFYECADKDCLPYPIGGARKRRLNGEPKIVPEKFLYKKLKPRVLNRYKDNTTNAVYIGRGSKWGNNYIIGKDGNRDEVCDKYEAEKSKDSEFMEMAKRELKGKDVWCYCAPARCHGDFLVRVANKE